MELRMILILAIALLLTPSLGHADGGNSAFRQEIQSKRAAFREGLKGENRNFREGMKGKSREERMQARLEHKGQNFDKRKEFRETLHQERMEHLKSQLAKNTSLTEEQKTQILQHRQTQYSENVAFREKQHQNLTAFIKQTQEDSSLSGAQKKDLIRNYVKQQNEAAKQYMETQQSENKEFRGGIKPAVN